MDFKLVLNCPNFVAFLMLVGNSFQIFGPMVKIAFILSSFVFQNRSYFLCCNCDSPDLQQKSYQKTQATYYSYIWT